MKTTNLIKNNLIKEISKNKCLCNVCNKQYTKQGIAAHYHYFHTKEGINSKNNISSKLKGKTRKELEREQELRKIQKDKEENSLGIFRIKI